MRFASALYLGVALLLAVSVGVVSFQQRSTAAGRATGPRQPCATLLIPGDAAAVHRLQAKNDVTRQLIDGQKTLLEAAAWFRYINAVTSLPRSDLHPSDETQSEEERACRQVIRWAVASLDARDKDHGPALTRRLERELKELLHKPGGIVLPAVE